MTKNSKVASIGGGIFFGFIVWIILIAWAYFYYGHSVDATIGFALLSAVYWLLSYISLIPVIGPIIYWALIAFWVEPSILHTVGLSHGDPVHWAFWLNMIGGIIFSIITTFFVVAALVGRD